MSTLEARRSANPKWIEVWQAIYRNRPRGVSVNDSPILATDAVMDTIYGKGQW